MTARTVRLNRFRAAACATVITAVSTWAFVDSTASIERDPFRFAAIMASNAKVRLVHIFGTHAGSAPEAVRNYGQPDVLVPPPACLKGCA
jgi:hypothetical protein